MATVKLEGFAELEAALDQLSKAAGKGVLRRSLIKSAEPWRKLQERWPQMTRVHLVLI